MLLRSCRPRRPRRGPRLPVGNSLPASLTSFQKVIKRRPRFFIGENGDCLFQGFAMYRVKILQLMNRVLVALLRGAIVGRGVAHEGVTMVMSKVRSIEIGREINKGKFPLVS